FLSVFGTAAPPPYTYPLSLHDALPISCSWVRLESITTGRGDSRIRRLRVSSPSMRGISTSRVITSGRCWATFSRASTPSRAVARSEEHTSELQLRENLVCRLLLEKKNT